MFNCRFFELFNMNLTVLPAFITNEMRRDVRLGRTKCTRVERETKCLKFKWEGSRHPVLTVALKNNYGTTISASLSRERGEKKEALLPRRANSLSREGVGGGRDFQDSAGARGWKAVAVVWKLSGRFLREREKGGKESGDPCAKKKPWKLTKSWNEQTLARRIAISRRDPPVKSYLRREIVLRPDVERVLRGSNKSSVKRPSNSKKIKEKGKDQNE